jgi:hypothetical protein
LFLVFPKHLISIISFTGSVILVGLDGAGGVITIGIVTFSIAGTSSFHDSSEASKITEWERGNLYISFGNDVAEYSNGRETVRIVEDGVVLTEKS